MKNLDQELMTAIEDVIDWLDYDVWAVCPGLEESVKQLRNKRMAKIAHEKRMNLSKPCEEVRMTPLNAENQ